MEQTDFGPLVTLGWNGTLVGTSIDVAQDVPDDEEWLILGADCSVSGGATSTRTIRIKPRELLARAAVGVTAGETANVTAREFTPKAESGVASGVRTVWEAQNPLRLGPGARFRWIVSNATAGDSFNLGLALRIRKTA